MIFNRRRILVPGSSSSTSSSDRDKTLPDTTYAIPQLSCPGIAHIFMSYTLNDSTFV